MTLLSFLDNLNIIAFFGALFGSILTAQLWLGEQIVFPQNERGSFLFILLIAVWVFVFTGTATWFVTDVVFGFLKFERNKNDEPLSAPSSSSASSHVIAATPSLFLLSIMWIFCAYSRLNEFAICLIVFAVAIISFFLVHSTGDGRRYSSSSYLAMLKNWICCNIVAAVGTWLSILAMKIIMNNSLESSVRPTPNKTSTIWAFTSNSLEEVLPLWWPALMLMTTTSWGEICRRVYKMSAGY